MEKIVSFHTVQRRQMTKILAIGIGGARIYILHNHSELSAFVDSNDKDFEEIYSVWCTDDISTPYGWRLSLKKIKKTLSGVINFDGATESEVDLWTPNDYDSWWHEKTPWNILGRSCAGKYNDSLS
jgi:hypothetical protein